MNIDEENWLLKAGIELDSGSWYTSTRVKFKTNLQYQNNSIDDNKMIGVRLSSNEGIVDVI